MDSMPFTSMNHTFVEVYNSGAKLFTKQDFKKLEDYLDIPLRTRPWSFIFRCPGKEVDSNFTSCEGDRKEASERAASDCNRYVLT
jgi:hypothetical protein